MLHKVLGRIAMAIVLTGCLLMGSAKPAQAFATCEQKIRKAERNLEKAIRRYGVHSAEAEKQRDKLETVRARCQQHS